MDFLAIGDTATDEFIRLEEARVNCDINNENCTISMRWGDKIPFEYATLVPGVGNAANAAVAAARLGLSTGFVSNIGKDRYGEETLTSFSREGIDTRHITVHENIGTNHHYVLWFESERTILIRHEKYPYVLPTDLEAPKWMYLSSMGESSESFHTDLADWLSTHPNTKLAFQPGTFQIKMGTTALAPLYAKTEVFACNKEEAMRILGSTSTDLPTLLSGLRALGPKIVVITDGRNGAYASDGSTSYHVPMYPDPRPPFERTGAGDATTSTIVAALALGKPLSEALLWGPVNAMSVVQEVGAQKGLLSRDVLETYLANAPENYRVSTLA